MDETRRWPEGCFIVPRSSAATASILWTPSPKRSDAILIDRGDLSREIPIERIPPAQKYIIRTAKKAAARSTSRPILLESMAAAPIPTRAEVNDIFNTLHDGADAACPGGRNRHRQIPHRLRRHGPKAGARVRQAAISTRRRARPFRCWPSLTVDRCAWPRLKRTPARRYTDVRSCQSLIPCCGMPNRSRSAFSRPLRALRIGKSSADPSWPIAAFPAARFDHADPLAVARQRSQTRDRPAPRPGKRSRTTHAVLDVGEVFRSIGAIWSSAGSARSAGASRRRLLAGPDVFIAGKVALVSAYRHPERLRAHAATVPVCLSQKGWTRVVGFHGRNVPMGPTNGFICRRWSAPMPTAFPQSDDLSARARRLQPGVVIDPTRHCSNSPNSAGRAVLGASSYLTAGARETVFDAQRRKNMGCSHFIVGPLSCPCRRLL